MKKIDLYPRSLAIKLIVKEKWLVSNIDNCLGICRFWCVAILASVIKSLYIFASNRDCQYQK